MMPGLVKSVFYISNLNIYSPLKISNFAIRQPYFLGQIESSSSSSLLERRVEG